MAASRHDPSPATPRVLGLVLAAGQSRRFGGDKRLAPFEGQTLLAATTAGLAPHVASLAVMLRHGEQPQALGLPPGPHVMRAPAAPVGMGISLARAVSELLASTDPDHQRCEALVLMLGDMPGVHADTLAGLMAHARHDVIVRPHYRDTPGHPVVFGRRFWPALAGLEGDEGARGLLRQYREHVVMLAVDDPGILDDIDTPDDLSALQ